MAVRIVAALFQKLLSLCQRCGRQSLHYLLYLYSVLLKCKDPDTCFPRFGDENVYIDKCADPNVTGGPPEGVHNASIESPVVQCSESRSSLLRGASHTTAPQVEKDGRETSTLSTSQPAETFIPEPERLFHLEDKTITCTFPAASARYRRRIAMYSERTWTLNFEPLETLNIHKDEHVPDWTPYVHPGGQLYFLNDTSSTLGFHYLTEAHLYDDQIREEVAQFIVAFERKSRAADLGQLPSNTEVVLQVDEGCWSYYMVDLDHRALFWIDAVAVDDESYRLPIYDVEKKEQLRHIFDCQFWRHVELFPSHRPLLHEVLEKLLAILTYSQVDANTLPSPTVPFDKQETETYLKAINYLREIQGVEGVTPYTVVASGKRVDLISCSLLD
ncbi:hypothetical protein M0805_001357 [Coniferiporia weirii]|nr:hypothetical protein M0805_001357 [Coniferiporia weirii]